MKKLQLIPYRKRDKRFKLKKHYIVEIKKVKNDFIVPIPDDIVKAYNIKIGDVAIFEVVNKNSFIVRLVKKTMYSFVEKLGKG